ncbi:hypothetical protein BX659_11052 [Orenia metallireducens]|jgi:hypothetical protein|uniref:Uncharacterized protein n=1 Tax=Orenia metallireducens TaxID=1413210 RepID=A0A285HYP4_9FIRM|nr:hypothetical protein BX659_11052 [Orenia metallireducens]SNY40842.1 hypothetical protein SAMN06265827_12752 [Orenia metallireducens]
MRISTIIRLLINVVEVLKIKDNFATCPGISI